MSTFWSTWVIVLAVVTFGISFLLLCWAPWVKIPTQADGTTTHVWAHGVLREGVKDLPRWWLVVSFMAFFAAALYVLLFPGLGNYRGLLNWTSTEALEQKAADHDTLMAALVERARAQPVEQLAADPDAVRIGGRLFVDNCSACHGNRAQGMKVLGAPNLLDGDWLYGGDTKSIMASILDGRQGVMAPFGSVIDAEGIGNLAHYVASLSGEPRDAVKAALGKPLFQSCSACHGPAGRGNTAMGAPNLSDGIWLYGGSIPEIERTIRDGRSGVMPAWRDRLGEDGAKLITAWIYRNANSMRPSE
jgi:cytochrome c oxidase cbb3-type subunit III